RTAWSEKSLSKIVEETAKKERWAGVEESAQIDNALALNIKNNLWKRWQTCVVKAGGETPNYTHGLDVRPVWSATDYIQKMPEAAAKKEAEGKKRWGAEAELTKAYMKEGRKNSRTVWEILDDARTNERDAELFAEYAEATFGRSQIEWSKGGRDLRKLFLQTDEVRDEELVYEDPDWVFEDELEDEIDQGDENLVIERITIDKSDSWRAHALRRGSIDRA